MLAHVKMCGDGQFMVQSQSSLDLRSDPEHIMDANGRKCRHRMLEIFQHIID